VNSKPIKKHVLHDGDVIEFGKYQLKYENKLQEKASENRNGFENTVLVRPAKLDVSTQEVTSVVEEQSEAPVSDNVTPAVVVPAPVESVISAEKIGHLQVLSGPNSGRDLVLNKALTTLGKPGVQVAVVTKRPHGYFVAHVEGNTMPLVNGQKIGAQAYGLNDHDVIDLAGVKMEFYLA
jgi:pSer/pThr/pTyr-binding forkhead associated (FHA) protein